MSINGVLEDLALADLLQFIHLGRGEFEDLAQAGKAVVGEQGSGKTTLARAVAQAALCERAPAPEPCGRCRCG